MWNVAGVYEEYTGYGGGLWALDGDGKRAQADAKRDEPRVFVV